MMSRIFGDAAPVAHADPAGRVLVKVCGITSAADAHMVEAAGADWVGLNFHPPSPRYIGGDARAVEVRAALRSACPVGLFVDRPREEVAERASRLGLATVQLHGDEPPDDVAWLKRAGLMVVRAFRLKDEEAIARLTAYLERCSEQGGAPDAVLVDAYVAGVPGGTGRTIADSLLEHLPALPNLILAGGLTPENVAGRVAAVRPWMVDVAGGVESAPGRKDRDLVAAFVRQARMGGEASF